MFEVPLFFVLLLFLLFLTYLVLSLKMRHSASPRGFSFFIPINASFKICFKLNELTRCPKIIEQVGQVLKNMQFSDFHRQDVVAFNFYLGRLKLIHHEFDAADQSLSMAWNLCPDEYSNQKRKILLYLTVTRLVLGKPPSFDLLQFYNLTDLFGDIILSIQQGNFAAFEYHVAQRQEWLMKYKCFGIIRYRTRVSVFRNLLRKMWQMQDSPRSISFNDFAVACQVSGLLEFTVDDAECTIQSLVDAGFVQGYINHGKRTVVVKGEVFPPMYPKY
ncbi:hypothetical protein BDR26DRAFT_641213 [Obelidium mucronatum]|nr:hypothetical protein BDR26DRAFT_641213 [Obelidium mucronatum]